MGVVAPVGQVVSSSGDSLWSFAPPTGAQVAHTSALLVSYLRYSATTHLLHIKTLTASSCFPRLCREALRKLEAPPAPLPLSSLTSSLCPLNQALLAAPSMSIVKPELPPLGIGSAPIGIAPVPSASALPQAAPAPALHPIMPLATYPAPGFGVSTSIHQPFAPVPMAAVSHPLPALAPLPSLVKPQPTAPVPASSSGAGASASAVAPAKRQAKRNPKYDREAVDMGDSSEESEGERQPKPKPRTRKPSAPASAPPPLAAAPAFPPGTLRPTSPNTSSSSLF
jgi:hypothetical protein